MRGKIQARNAAKSRRVVLPRSEPIRADYEPIRASSLMAARNSRQAHMVEMVSRDNLRVMDEQ